MPPLDETQLLDEPKFTQLLRVLLAKEIEADPRFTGKPLLSRDPGTVYAALQPIVRKLSRNPEQSLADMQEIAAGGHSREVTMGRAVRDAALYSMLLKLGTSLHSNRFPDLGMTYDHLLT